MLVYENAVNVCQHVRLLYILQYAILAKLSKDLPRQLMSPF